MAEVKAFRASSSSCWIPASSSRPFEGLTSKRAASRRGAAADCCTRRCGILRLKPLRLHKARSTAALWLAVDKAEMSELPAPALPRCRPSRNPQTRMIYSITTSSFFPFLSQQLSVWGCFGISALLRAAPALPADGAFLAQRPKAHRF